MRKRIVLGISLFVLYFLVLFLLMPTPRLVLWGWLHDQPFYQNRPVCWWSEQLQGCYEEFRPLNFINSPFPQRLAPDLTPGDEGLAVLVASPDQVIWAPPPPFRGKRTNKWFSKFIKIKPLQMAFLDGDPAAVPVLQQLLRDGNPNVQRIAMQGIRRAGNGSREVVAAVEPLVRHRDPMIRREARYTLLYLQSAERG